MDFALYMYIFTYTASHSWNKFCWSSPNKDTYYV